MAMKMTHHCRVPGTMHVEDGLRKLRQMENTTGIWTMRCILLVERRFIVILDKNSGVIFVCVDNKTRTLCSSDKFSTFISLLQVTTKKYCFKPGFFFSFLHFFPPYLMSIIPQRLLPWPLQNALFSFSDDKTTNFPISTTFLPSLLPLMMTIIDKSGCYDVGLL
jgi:hypothetical protein